MFYSPAEWDFYWLQWMFAKGVSINGQEQNALRPMSTDYSERSLWRLIWVTDYSEHSKMKCPDWLKTANLQSVSDVSLCWLQWMFLSLSENEMLGVTDYSESFRSRGEQMQRDIHWLQWTLEVNVEGLTNCVRWLCEVSPGGTYWLQWIFRTWLLITVNLTQITVNVYRL